MATPSQDKDPVREDLVEAGIRLLAEQGTGALVMRRVAAAAGVSTMCVYSRFGDKAGLLDAVYQAGFDRLEKAMVAVTASDPLERAVNLALAYRSFAVANPALYSLMFERVVGFDPPTEVQTAAPRASSLLMVEAMRQAIETGMVESDSPTTAAYMLWTAVHGTVGLELARESHHPVPGWLIDVPETGETMFREVIETTLRGMAPAVPIAGGS
ncbi:MAG: TetR/AcrR family transcriptional regulator [Acidimicrobiia bacterium]